MSVNFILDLHHRICHEDTAVRVRRTHLRLWTLQCREKLGVYEGRFGIPELLGDVTGQAEVRVLVDCTGDQAGDVGYLAEDVGE